MKKIILIMLSFIFLTSCAVKSDSTNPNAGKNVVTLHEFNNLDYNTLKAGSHDADTFIFDFGFKNNFVQLVCYFRISVNGVYVKGSNGKYNYFGFDNQTWDENGVPDNVFKDLKLMISLNRNAYDNDATNDYVYTSPFALSLIPIFPNDTYGSMRNCISTSDFPTLDGDSLTLYENNLVSEKIEYHASEKFSLGYVTYKDDNDNLLKLELQAMVVTDFDKRV